MRLLNSCLPGLVVLVLAAGCGEPAQIQEYVIPKTPPKADPHSAIGQARPMPERSGRSGPPSYEVPKEWTKIADKSLSRGTFQVSNDDEDTLVTIIPLGPLTEEMVLPNVNRWRRQLNLAPLAPGDPLDDLEEIQTADGLTGRYLKLVGEGGQAMLMMFVESGGRTWYFKLMGDAELVQKEEPRFESFVQSVRFSPAEEAGDE